MNYKTATGIYIHVPFCASKCDYCSFYSVVGIPRLYSSYLESIVHEINYRARLDYSERIDIRTIYFGGGTPSILDPSIIEEILKALNNNFDLSKIEEMTIEMNPDSVTKDSLSRYFQMGFNRLSVGIQSFDDRVLKTINRIHNSHQARAALDMIAESEFDNFSLDLMYALPNQSLSSVVESLKILETYQPPHVSTYSLILEDSPLSRRVERGELVLPDQDLEHEMLQIIDRSLKENGLNRYEISNYSKPGFESKHNSLYWNMDSYFGFGPSASSFLSGCRMTNVSDLDTYVNESRVEFDEVVLEDDRILKEEMIFTGLRRLEGIDSREYEKLFCSSLERDYSKTLEKLIERGLLQKEDTRYSLTKRGLEIANIVFLEFIN